VLDEACRSIRNPTDEGPRTVEDTLKRHANKVPDAISDDAGEPGGAADQVQAADDPASPKQGPRDVVPGEALAKRVVGGHQVLSLERSEVKRRLGKEKNTRSY